MPPDISVIVPNLNSPMIDRTLTALRQQIFDLDRVEVIVVGLDEPGLVNEDRLVRLISTGCATSSAWNRNLGMRAAQGEIFCFTDADCIPRPDWLAHLIAPYRDPEIGVVGGSVAFEDSNYWAFCDNLSWFFKFLEHSAAGERSHLPSLNLSVRRQVVEHVGDLDESYPLAAGEDTEWTMRMRWHGYRLHFEPRAVVRHAAKRHTLWQIWEHGYNYGRFSPKIRRPNGHVRLTMEDELIPNHWWLLLALSPLYSTLATVRIILTSQETGKWKAVPGIWFSKLAWCAGASQALRLP